MDEKHNRICDLIKSTFQELSLVDLQSSDSIVKIGNSRIVFPRKAKGELRVSEQEVKQIFISLLEKELKSGDTPLKDFYYSVETPTLKAYSFNKGAIKQVDIDGQSALIDVTLYKGDKLFAHIEFKSHNPKKEAIQKDFLKLYTEESDNKPMHNYFVHVLTTQNNGTLPNVMGKYKELEGKEDSYQKSTNKVSVHLFVMNDHEYYVIDDAKDDNIYFKQRL